MTCKNCQQPFTIGQTGQDILNTLKFPLPGVCDVCAIRLLMAFRNERTFYSRQCDHCHKSIISMYPQLTPFTVFCRDCWWGDDWEGQTFGRDYTGPENFFQELKELQRLVPREALVNLNSPDCEYSNHIRDSKSCYMCSLVSDQSEECFYCYWIVTVKDSADCYYGRNNQRCYFCVVTRGSYNCSYLLQAEDCLDCHYCYDIRGCKNCLFSCNLRNQSYVFRNKQLTKEDYEKAAAEIDRGSWSKSLAYRCEWQESIATAIHQYSYQNKCENCTGDNMQNCINNQVSFNSFESENTHNAPSTLCATNIFNGFAVGTQPVNWGSNVAVIKGGSQVISCYNTVFSSDIYFCENLVSCLDCLGCIGLQKKKFCILNKQYSESEYRKIKDELLVYWRQTGQISEFFPKEFSAFAYNETAAQDFYSLEKESALKLGFRWQDELPGSFGRETLEVSSIPDNINEVPDDILQEVLACNKCQKNYKLIKQELKLYRSLGVPVPRSCQDCRHRERLALMGKRKLFERRCDCQQSEHGHAGQCSRSLLTRYGPEERNVLCEECYQKEIY